MLAPVLRHVALVVLLLAPSLSAAQPCDPYSSTVPAPIPRALRLRTTCGNGRIDRYAVSCQRTESGGCGLPRRRATSCTKNQETCDGKALAGQTCQALGYAGGALRCAASCERFDVARCTLCPAAATCRERTVTSDAYQDFTLIAQGNAVRAFWYDRAQFQVADVDAKGALGPAKVLAPMGSYRLIPVRVGASALTIVGALDKPQLSVVRATGAPSLVPLPGKVSSFFMPVLPIPGQDRALAILGEPYDGALAIVDSAGRLHPPKAAYGQNTYRRAALIAVAPGKHVLRWAKYEVDLETQPGDLLWLMHDYRTLVALVRRASVVPLGHPVREVPGLEAIDVRIDGRFVAQFGRTEDVIGTRTYPLPVKPTPARKLLAPRAYQGEVSIARTATREVHAARVPEGDGIGRTTTSLVIAVGAVP